MIANVPTTAANEAQAAVNLDREFDQLADALAARFEELSLIRDFSASLDMDHDSFEVVRVLLKELAPCVGLNTLAVAVKDSTEPMFHGVGDSLSPEAFDELRKQAIEHSAGDKSHISICNSLDLSSGGRVHVVVVPVTRAGEVLGHMVGVRDASEPELGTIEADVMNSTSTMLAVHLINRRQFTQLQEMLRSTIQAFVCAIDAKDKYTHGHSTRVCNLSVALASKLGYNDVDLENLRMGAILHDIGKIGIDDAVLRKPGKLTDEEYNHIKLHPVIGYEIIKGIPQFQSFLPAIRSHHECWNGRGYPDGLIGDEIPRDAQIVAVADAFDAMASDRPYRRGMPFEKIRSIFSEGRGEQWTSDVVDVFLSSPELIRNSMKASQTNFHDMLDAELCPGDTE